MLGTTLASRFAIHECVGRGGMGVVYRASDLQTGEQVAIKVLALASSSDVVRFLREWEALRQLTHPRIVRGLASGRTEQGAPFLALEWLDGEDLSVRLARGALSVDEALWVLEQLAHALAAAHRAGFVHRDVKPANVFLVGRRVEEIRLLDFGIAHHSDAATLTRTGAIVGTPAYMAPEQASSAATIGPAADAFALGALLHEMLTGAPAFAGDSVLAVLAKILFADPPRLEIDDPRSASLSSLLEALLAKDPVQRPSDLGAIAGTACTLRVAPPTAGPPIGHRERRMVAVLLTSPEAPMLAPTLELSPPSARPPTQSPMQLRTLPNGSLVAAFEGQSAQDRALAAVWCALSLRRSRPDLSLSVATALGTGAPTDAAIDRAAARLGTVSPGDVALCEQTAALVRERFEISNGLVIGPVRSFAETPVLGVVAGFAGRAKELGFLEAAIAEAVEERAVRAVVVSGEPGLGKSRLRRELARRVGEWSEPPDIWLGRGEEIAAASPYSLLASLLRHVLGVREGDSHAAVDAAIASRPGARDWQTPALTAAFIKDIVGGRSQRAPSPAVDAAREDGPRYCAAVSRAVGQWLAGEARARPVVMFLEDLHWADLQSVQVLESALQEQAAALPIAVIGLSRPNPPAELALERVGATRLRLSPLAASAATRLVSEILGGRAHADDLSVLVARCGGAPLLLEEVARAYASGGLDAATGTLGALLEARLLALAADERRVLRAASVLGERFWPGAIASLVGLDRSVVEHHLTRLGGLEVVVPVRSRFSHEPELAFRHALVRDVAYGMLPEAERRRAHWAAADWLLEAGEHDSHRVLMHRELGAEDDAQILLTLELLLPAVRFMSIASLSRDLQRARALASRLTTSASRLRIEVRCATAELHLARHGALSDIEPLVARCLCLAREAGEHAAEAIALASHAAALAGRGHGDAAETRLAAAMAALGANADEDAARHVDASAFLVRYYSGRIDDLLLTAAMRILARERRRRSRLHVVWAHNVADTLLRLGRPREALPLLDEAEAAAASLGLPEAEVGNTNLRATAMAMLGVEETEVDEQTLASPWEDMEGRLHRLICHALRGRRDRALEIARTLESDARRLGHVRLADEARDCVVDLEAGRQPWYRGGQRVIPPTSHGTLVS